MGEVDHDVAQRKNEGLKVVLRTIIFILSRVSFNVPLHSIGIDLWMGSALDVFLKIYPREELRFSHFRWDLSLVLVPLADLYEGSKE